MSLAQRFERRLEGLVGGASPGCSRARSSRSRSASALQREASDKRNVMGNGQVLVARTATGSPWRRPTTSASCRGRPADQLARRARPGVPGRERLGRPSATSRSTWPATTSCTPACSASRRGWRPTRRRAAARTTRCPCRSCPGMPLGQYPAARARTVGAGAPPAAGCRPSGRRTHRRPAPHPFGAADPALPQPPPFQPPRLPAAAATARSSNKPPPGQRRTAVAMLVVDEPTSASTCAPAATSIGRGTDSDLQLLDQGISRRHLDIQYDGNFATAYDLGSTNGTDRQRPRDQQPAAPPRRRHPGGPHAASCSTRSRREDLSACTRPLGDGQRRSRRVTLVNSPSLCS